MKTLPFSTNGHTINGERPASCRAIIPATLANVYSEVVAKAVELRDQGLTLAQIIAELNRLRLKTRTGKPYRHATQLCKLFRSFGGDS